MATIGGRKGQTCDLHVHLPPVDLPFSEALLAHVAWHGTHYEPVGMFSVPPKDLYLHPQKSCHQLSRSTIAARNGSMPPSNPYFAACWLTPGRSCTHPAAPAGSGVVAGAAAPLSLKLISRSLVSHGR